MYMQQKHSARRSGSRSSGDARLREWWLWRPVLQPGIDMVRGVAPICETHLHRPAQGGQFSLQLEAVGDELRPAAVQGRQLLRQLRHGRRRDGGKHQCTAHLTLLVWMLSRYEQVTCICLVTVGAQADICKQ